MLVFDIAVKNIVYWACIMHHNLAQGTVLFYNLFEKRFIGLDQVKDKPYGPLVPQVCEKNQSMKRLDQASMRYVWRKGKRYYRNVRLQCLPIPMGDKYMVYLYECSKYIKLLGDLTAKQQYYSIGNSKFLYLRLQLYTKIYL